MPRGLFGFDFFPLFPLALCNSKNLLSCNKLQTLREPPPENYCAGRCLPRSWMMAFSVWPALGRMPWTWYRRTTPMNTVR